MDRATAKREACFHASRVIRSALENGWDLQEVKPEYSDVDVRKVEAGLHEVIVELERRGWK